MRGAKFLHISDLHFSRYEGSNSVKQEIDQFEVKKEILRYISALIERENVKAVLISGDIESDRPSDIFGYFSDWIDRGSKVFLVFGEHDSSQIRNEFKVEAKKVDNLYIIEGPQAIECSDLGITVYGMSCLPNQENFKAKFNLLKDHNFTHPSIFLTHPDQLPENTVKKIGCSYYAVGHIHYPSIEKVSDKIIIGRPGHIFSVWDGSGKAWPTGAILGKFNSDGVEVKWFEFPFPQTRRLFVDPYTTDGDKLLICLENCPEDKFKMIAGMVKGEWINEGYRGVFKGYYSPSILPTETITKYILGLFKEDFFVTPSDSRKMKKKYGFNRACFKAGTLLRDRGIFNEYIERIFKATPRTQ